MISEEGSAALIKILLDRGYFHDDVPILKSEVDTHDDDPASSTPPPTTSSLPLYSPDDALLVPTLTGCYLSLDDLKEQFCAELSIAGGRWTLQEAATVLCVAEKHVERILPAILVEHCNRDGILRVGQDILTRDHVALLTRSLVSLLRQESETEGGIRGRMPLSDVARDVFRLPVDTTLRILKEHLPSNVHIRLLHNGSRVLVTQLYLDDYQNQVCGTFLALQEPATVSAIAQEHSWEVAWVLECLENVEKDLPGNLHGDHYVPHVFTDMQRQAVLCTFTTAGFVTTSNCHSLGLSPAEMKAHVSAAFPSAVELNEAVINPDVVLSALEDAILETITAGSFLDIQLHLPMELGEIEEDANEIVHQHVLSKMKNPGVAVVSSEEGSLFASQSVIDEVTKQILPPLIEPFAKSKAQEMMEQAPGTEASPCAELVEEPSASKGKRKGKKKTKKVAHGKTSVDYGVVPLAEIVRAVSASYPDVAEFAREHDGISYEETTGEGSTVARLCREAFCTEDFRAACARAVQAELRRLESERVSKARISRKEAASKVQSVDGAFEDPQCFVAACYMVQAWAKFLNYASSSADPRERDLDLLKRDFLRGVACDFTARLTQYCLFKHEVEEGVFSFSYLDQNPDKQQEEEGGEEVEGKGEEDQVKTLFCSAVETATRRYRPLFFSAQPRDPLPTLRDGLPGTIGISLARQWVLCGGECYQGGVKRHNGDNEGSGGETYTRPGDVDGFLAHVEENCLAVCQLPFKKLDKKSEKQFLFARRQRLSRQLEQASDPEVVLEFTIMLLFQLVKNLVVSGEHLRGPILHLLTKERKISEEVARELHALASQIESGDEIDVAVVDRVRECGLSKPDK